MKLKSILKTVLPRKWQEVWRARRMERRYRGNYSSWAEAKADSTGYAATEILHRVVAATRATRQGDAAWERDTVLFAEPWAHFRLLNTLQHVVHDQGYLDVLDFGGALGSTWWQHRQWLPQPELRRWSVVEQPDFVAAGRQEFEQGPLRFFDSVDACLRDGRPNVVLLSSVLPYLEDPRTFLRELASRVTGTLIIDRTGFVNTGPDRLAVQHVPESVYPASYPCWLFSDETLREALGASWNLLDEWQSFDGDGQTFRYRGLVFARRETIPEPLTS